MQKFSGHPSMRQREISLNLKCKFIVTNCKDTLDLNYKLQLLASEYVFLWIILYYFEGFRC